MCRGLHSRTGWALTLRLIHCLMGVVKVSRVFTDIDSLCSLDRVSASRGPLPLLSCIEETLSPATPFPRPPPAPVVQYETFRPSLSDREAGGGGGQAAPNAMQFPPLVGAESVVEAASPSRRPPPGFARSLHAGSAQGRSRPDHTGLPVIDKHRASMRCALLFAMAWIPYSRSHAHSFRFRIIIEDVFRV